MISRTQRHFPKFNNKNKVVQYDTKYIALYTLNEVDQFFSAN